MKTRIKGKFTFQSAGVLLVVSAIVELFSIRSPVPLFGSIRGGPAAAVYHLVYVALYFLLGFGLYKARPWAYRLVFAATAVYTLDRLVLVLDTRALEAYLAALLGKYGVAAGGPETGLIVKVGMLAAGLSAACWWGFAGYAFLRREYFQRNRQSGSPVKG
ncbi:MAG: hypothetical protein AB1427_12235 [Thermodesulfobacteriota bacterium]